MKNTDMKLIFKKTLIFSLTMLLLTACGPSKEELEKQKQEDKAREEIVLSSLKKNQAAIDEFINNLKELKNKLNRVDSATDFNIEMDPAIKAGLMQQNSNLMVMSYEAITDSELYEDGDMFDIFLGEDISTLMGRYKKIKEGKIGEVYTLKTASPEEIEKIFSSMSVKTTPYVLVVKRDTLVKIKIEGDNKFSGGETSGFLWLADLRSMKILGRLPVFAQAGQISTKDSDKEAVIQQKAILAGNEEVNKIVKAWLQKFKGADIQ